MPLAPPPSRHLWRVSIAGTLLVSACVFPGVGPESTSSRVIRKPTIKATARPGLSPRPRQSAEPSQAPGASSAPTSKPSPNLPLSPTNKALLPKLEEKLALVARVGFNMARGQLVADNGAVTTGGVGLISNNGSGLIANNGGAYRVTQADAPLFDPEPGAGEKLAAERHYPDGTRLRLIATELKPVLEDFRQVEFDPSGKATEHAVAKSFSTWPSTGKLKYGERQFTSVHPDGSLRTLFDYTLEMDETDRLTKLSFKNKASRFRDEAVGAAVDLEALELDMLAGTGTFRYSYPKLSLVESGTLANVKLTTKGKAIITKDDPLGYYDGESRVEDAAGTLLFTKKQTRSAGKVVREYGLGDGLSAVLERQGDGTFKGPLKQNDAVLAQAHFATKPGGTVVISLTFPEAPDTPVSVGFGLTAEAEAAPASPATPTPTRVLTLAGAGAPGFADGAGSVARFNELSGAVASRVTPGRFYVADSGNHRIRVVTVTGTTASVATYAGDGTAGGTDGNAASARFSRPFGLAAGPDDTLFVTEEAGHRVRRIAPGGTVSTIAGAGVAGFAEGTGSLARFNNPTGIAVDAAGNLFVADHKNHRIRKITPAGVVTTLAGDGTAGYVEGPGTTARFNHPLGLAIDGTGRLYVADRDNLRVRRVSATGETSLYAGNGDPLKIYQDGGATTGGITHPFALAILPSGQLYIAQFDIRTVSADGSKLGTLAGQANFGYADGTNKEALFTLIFGLAPGADGTLLVADDHRLRLVVPPPAN